jgi:hypothetical protein
MLLSLNVSVEGNVKQITANGAHRPVQYQTEHTDRYNII